MNAPRHEEELERPDSAPTAGPHSPYHFALLWLMEWGILVENITHASDRDGYKQVRLVDINALSAERRQLLLDSLQAFHLAKLFRMSNT